MRSKTFLAGIWVLATLAAIVVVWQSLGFVSSRTDEPIAGQPLPTSSLPALPGGGSSTSANPTTVDPGVTATTRAPSTEPATSLPIDTSEQTFELVGGSTRIRFSPAGVEFLWAAAADGYQYEVEQEGTGIKVEFRSDSHRSRVDAWWDNGPQNAVREGED